MNHHLRIIMRPDPNQGGVIPLHKNLKIAGKVRQGGNYLVPGSRLVTQLCTSSQQLVTSMLVLERNLPQIYVVNLIGSQTEYASMEVYQ